MIDKSLNGKIFKINNNIKLLNSIDINVEFWLLDDNL